MQRRIQLNTEQLNILKEKAKKNRLLALEGIFLAKSGHPGGSFSIAELVTYLYNCEMKVSPEDPKNPNRDRLVLSKGHAAPALYAALAPKGFFPEEEMKSLRDELLYSSNNVSISENNGNVLSDVKGQVF